MEEEKKTEIKTIFASVGGNLGVASFPNQGVKFLLFRNEGDSVLRHLVTVIHELYFRGEYSKYDCKGRTVVDVGAYLGDTAIWFMKNGAKNVIAYEPYATGMLVYANCVLNDVANVKLCQNAITYDHCAVAADPNRINDGGSQLDILEDAEKGKEIISLTLHDIAVQDAILKMDCEEAEHAIFRTVEAADLQKFEFLMVECHTTFEDVKANIEAKGFAIDEVKQEFFGPHGTWILYAHRK